jgi:IclR family acetate operon transcriptional repressor
MGVQGIKSGARLMVVLEEIAKNQPVSLSTLVQKLGDDKSAISRSLVTLAEAGWISAAPGGARDWQLTNRIHEMAAYARESDSLRRAAGMAMARLRDDFGETALLAMREANFFVIVEVAESREVLRIAPRVGYRYPALGSASAAIISPFLSESLQAEWLGHAPNESDLASFRKVREAGYAVHIQGFAQTNEGREAIRSTTIGAPIFDYDGTPVAALAVGGPSERISPERYEELGRAVKKAAQEIAASSGRRSHRKE